MPTGLLVGTTDLDDIFEAKQAGDLTAIATGIIVAGADLNARYAERSMGSAGSGGNAILTGFKAGIYDLNALFAKKGDVNRSQVVSPLPSLYDGANSSNIATAGLRVGSDGKCYARGATAVYTEIVGGAWHKSPAAGVGSGHYVKFTQTAGSVSISNTGVWRALSANCDYTLTAAEIEDASGTWAISTSASDAGIVSTGTWELFAEGSIQ